jgi:hypothetical protein
MTAGTLDGAAAPRQAAVGRCPRCAVTFRCGVDDPTPCPCSTVVTSPSLRARLQGLYTGCLCVPCLEALAAGERAAADPAA